MSDYTVESVKKKKPHYQKHRNKNKTAKKTQDEQPQVTSEQPEKAAAVTETPVNKANKPNKISQGAEPKAATEEKETKKQPQKNQKNPKEQKPQQEAAKGNKKNKKGNKEKAVQPEPITFFDSENKKSECV